MVADWRRIRRRGRTGAAFLFAVHLPESAHGRHGRTADRRTACRWWRRSDVAGIADRPDAAHGRHGGRFRRRGRTAEGLPESGGAACSMFATACRIDRRGARSNGGRFRRRGGVWFSVVFLERGARKRAVKHGQAEKRRTGGAESARKRKPPFFIGDCLLNRLFYRAKRETTPAPAEIMVYYSPSVTD